MCSSCCALCCRRHAALSAPRNASANDQPPAPSITSKANHLLSLAMIKGPIMPHHARALSERLLLASHTHTHSYTQKMVKCSRAVKAGKQASSAHGSHGEGSRTQQPRRRANAQLTQATEMKAGPVKTGGGRPRSKLLAAHSRKQRALLWYRAG